MATSHQRRPDAKQTVQKPDVELRAELEKAEAQKRALEQRGGDTEVDAEVLARMQPAVGNAAVQALLNRGTETVSATSSGEAAMEEQQEEEKDKEKDEDKEKGGVEQVLPSFSTGGGGGGGAPPWAMGHEFGGDADDDAGVLETASEGWRPMPLLPDPDDDEADIDGVAAEEAGDPAVLRMRQANRALGTAPWTPSLLSRGMRHARRLGRRDFAPESLVDAIGMDHALGRLRALLRFVARHGDGDAAVLLARVGTIPGAAVFPQSAGFAGATARAAALAEQALVLLPPGWEAVLEVALDVRARPRAEHAAAVLAARGRLSAPAIYERAGGVLAEGGDVELDVRAHPGAVAALVEAARTDPLPVIDLWERPTARGVEAGDVEAIDAIIAAFTGAEDPPAGLAVDELRALYDGITGLIGGLGGMQVETAAAALAAAPWTAPGEVSALLVAVDVTLRRSARRLVEAGEALEALLGTEDVASARAISVEAVAVRGTAELVRTGALAALARMLLSTEAVPSVLPLDEAERAWRLGTAAGARPQLARAATPPEHLHAAALLAAMGFPEDAPAHLSRATCLPPPLEIAARSLEAGLHLSAGRVPQAAEAARAQLSLARAAGAPFSVADAAITLSVAAEDWKVPLREAAKWLRARGEGAALNLLKARWAENVPARR